MAFERCQAFIDCQLHPRGVSEPVIRPLPEGPAVTLSRQTGCGAAAVAEKLADYLQRHDQPSACPWTVFDRNLVEKVVEEHNLPKRLVNHMPEQRLSYVEDAIEELLGLHPASWTLAHKTMETILHLAQMGRVILIGRGANVITSCMKNAFHVRLVASLDTRIKRIAQDQKLSEKEAAEVVKKHDRGRERYLREHFNRDINDPLLYHMILNTDLVPYEEATRIVGEAALNHFRSCRQPAD